jgi:hypothetical protein
MSADYKKGDPMTNETESRGVGQEQVPSGWKLVPIEPTEEMWTAGRDPIMYRDMGYKVPAAMEAPPWRVNPTTGEVEKDQSKGTTAVHVWRAMLAAAPIPTPTSDAAVGDGVVKDAARYRWLRQWADKPYEFPIEDPPTSPEDMDAVIDAALAGQEGKHG